MTWNADIIPFFSDDEDEGDSFAHYFSNEQANFRQHCPYGTLGGATTVKTPDTIRKDILDFVKLTREDTLLDIGCGEGDLIIDCLSNFVDHSDESKSPQFVIGVDISGTALKKAFYRLQAICRRKSAELNLCAGVSKPSFTYEIGNTLDLFDSFRIGAHSVYKSREHVRSQCKSHSQSEETQEVESLHKPSESAVTEGSLKFIHCTKGSYDIRILLVQLDVFNDAVFRSFWLPQATIAYAYLTPQLLDRLAPFFLEWFSNRNGKHGSLYFN